MVGGVGEHVAVASFVRVGGEGIPSFDQGSLIEEVVTLLVPVIDRPIWWSITGTSRR
jgi:hypothetical protein